MSEKDEKRDWYLSNIRKYKRLFSLYKIEYKEKGNHRIVESNGYVYEKMFFDSHQAIGNALSIGLSVSEYQEHWFLQEAYNSFKKEDAKKLMIEKFINHLPKNEQKLIDRHLISFKKSWEK